MLDENLKSGALGSVLISKTGKSIFNINSLWPSYTIWQHRSGSPLAQVMVLLPDGTKPLLEPMLT